MKRCVVKNMRTDVSDEANSSVSIKNMNRQVSLKTFYLSQTTRFHVPEIPDLYIIPNLTVTKCTSKATNTALSVIFCNYLRAVKFMCKSLLSVKCVEYFFYAMPKLLATKTASGRAQMYLDKLQKFVTGIRLRFK